MKRDIAILISTLLGALYFIYFYFAKEEINAGSLGTLGDFIGGNINPILTFISTILLIETLSLQRKATQAAEQSAEEAKQTVKDQGLLIRTQIFESSFFNLINLCLEDCKNSKLSDRKDDHYGSKTFYFIENIFSLRKEHGEKPEDIIEDLELLHGDIIYSTIKSFSTAFGFINESAPEGKKDHYVSLATKLTPVPVIYLICIAKIHTNWPILKPFDKANFFEKNGIRDLLDGYR
ncbi:hypothetical protein [Pseudomonas sp. PD9R]|uniref:hypothetical protein n=1 Tax=Pseudomonas sp. PD9R TaxID=2853534 RepID=UPI001C43BF25|nr:hypothetical protein [Pseudomonas sp. PD9R]MBV6822277.1 hypothetical protein [Pseudomonas sp. PD9R]